MFSKVKKFGSKIFGDSPSSAGKDVPAEKDSKGSFLRGSFAKGSAAMEVDGSAKGSFSRLQPEASTGSKSNALPPVHVNGSGAQPVVPTAPRPPAAVAGLMGPTNTGRRKSTPAALDMALRTAEGRAAIEELVSSGGKKQMVFGQYFGAPGTAAAAAPAQGPGKATSRFLKAAVMANTGPSASDKQIHSVAEDEDSAMGENEVSSPVKRTAPSQTAASQVPSTKRPVTTPTSSSVGHTTPPPPHPPQESEPLPGRRTKILSLMPQLPTGMSRKYWSLSDYSIMRKMYTGYASTVYQATCKKSLEQVALKVYHMENLCELNHYQVFREIRLHSCLAHQHIIQLYCSFQEGNDVVMVQEYAEGGDLYRLLHRNGGRLAERQAVEMVLHPFLLSLNYLHTHGIMHRDIKPENVLFTEHRILKLADFGLAIDLNEERAVTRAGTLDYMAPEVLRCPPKNLPQENKNNASLHYNNSVDAWAVGVFAYELIVGFPPFAGESQLDSVDKIIHSTPEFPEKISELAKAFIIAALKKHPGDRPSVMEMLHHPWIRSYQRRASVLMPAAMRRRSSNMVNPNPGLPSHMDHGAAGQLAGGQMAGSKPLNVAAAAAAAAQGSGQAAAQVNPENMTTQEIEDMIRSLQATGMPRNS